MGRLRKVGAQFAQVSWQVARDRRLTPSLEALGAHTLIQATPDDFEVSVEWLAGQKSNGYRAAKKAVDELIAAGLYHRVRVREGRLWRTYVVCPTTPCTWEVAVQEAGFDVASVSRAPEQTGPRKLQVAPGSAVVGTPQTGTPDTGTPAGGDPVDDDPYRESHEREWEEEVGDQERAAAAAMLGTLSGVWRLGPVDVTRLAPLVAKHLRAGWSPDELKTWLTQNPGGVKNPAVVLERKRLPNVPAPVRRVGPVRCDEHRLVLPCWQCTEDRIAAER